MNFDHSRFETKLSNYVAVNYIWQQWKQTSGELNQTMGYTKGGFDYVTWYQETSTMKGGAGMLVSCKIDFKRATGDDHIIIMTGFTATKSGPVMTFAQASVQFHGSDDNNVIGAPIQAINLKTGAIAAVDFGQAVYDSLNASISTADFGHVDDSTEGRRTLPDIARYNVDAIMQSATQ